MKYEANKLKEKMIRNQQTYGCWVTIGHPLIPEILKFAGFEWLVVDLQHSSIDLETLLPILIAIEASDMVPLVRLGDKSSHMINAVMDAGAYGIIAADVRSRQEAEMIVSRVKYPPIGERGVGLYRAQQFGESFDSYKKWVNEQSIVIVQIEHKDAVMNIDEILRVPGIDAFMVGPYDLSGSFGFPGNFDHPKMVAALDEVLKAAKKYNIVAGFHSVSSESNEAERRRREGYRFLAFGTDFMFMKDGAKHAMKTLMASS